MLQSWYFLIAFVVALLVAFCNTPVVKILGFKYGYIDVPSDRKVHRQPIVRIGGISIYTATLVALLLVQATGGLNDISVTVLSKLGWLALGGTAFFLVGLADDLLSLSPVLRLLLQLGIAGLMWFAGIRIEFLTIPSAGLTHLGWFSLPLTVLWIVGVVNAINWIDGLDGLASGVAATASIVIFLVCLFMDQPVASLVMAALTGSLLGFLYYNFNPAQIFMGDGGSYFIGFTIASTSTVGLAKGATALAIVIPLIILAVPILDMSAVILKRICYGRSPFIADKSHLHHFLLRTGLSHRLTVLVIYALNLWAGSVAIMLVGIPYSSMILVAATGVLVGITWQAWRAVH